MALVLQCLDDFHTLLNKYGDPRTANWLFMSSPFYTLGICLSYVYTAKVLGPKLMANRKPYQLKTILIAYNLFQVIFSTWLFYETRKVKMQKSSLHFTAATSYLLEGSSNSIKNLDLLVVAALNRLSVIVICVLVYNIHYTISMSGWLTGRYSLRCQPVDYSNHPDAIRITHIAWWYYFSKFTEFMDTIFFVLRKKYSQVTTLHVIHHGIMPMSVWFGVKFTPGGHSTFFGFLNTFVHIVMYSYYLLAALGPQMQKYLWWKKYLTTLQMVQFVLIMVHAFQLLFIDCNYPRAFVWFIGMHAVMFLFLFKDFYNQIYSKRIKKEV